MPAVALAQKYVSEQHHTGPSSEVQCGGTCLVILADPSAAQKGWGEPAEFRHAANPHLDFVSSGLPGLRDFPSHRAIGNPAPPAIVGIASPWPGPRPRIFTGCCREPEPEPGYGEALVTANLAPGFGGHRAVPTARSGSWRSCRCLASQNL